MKAMRTMKIGQIGVRIDFFWTTIFNESELLEKFEIEVLPFDMCEFVRNVKQRADSHADNYTEELAEIKKSLSFLHSKDIFMSTMLTSLCRTDNVHV